MIEKLKIDKIPHQTFEIIYKDENYFLDLDYNYRNKTFYLKIRLDNVVLLQGVPVKEGANIVEPFNIDIMYMFVIDEFNLETEKDLYLYIADEKL